MGGDSQIAFTKFEDQLMMEKSELYFTAPTGVAAMGKDLPYGFERRILVGLVTRSALAEVAKEAEAMIAEGQS